MVTLLLGEQAGDSREPPFLVWLLEVCCLDTCFFKSVLQLLK